MVEAVQFFLDTAPMVGSLSVVMPYYENHLTLGLCIESLTPQRPREIIVVDDGSSHSARQVLASLGAVAAAVTLIEQANRGQSAATNAGVQAARGELVLLTCADIEAHSDLVRSHLRAHARAEIGEIGVQGYLPYAAAVPVTLFRRYLEASGRQFAFAELADGKPMDHRKLYAPNVSLRRTRFLALGGFDEALTYGWQDVDLGLRLARARVPLVYCQRAIGWHHHPISLAAYARREEKVGRDTWLMMRKHPDLVGDFRSNMDALVRGAKLLPNLHGLLRNAQAMEAHLAANGASPVPPLPADKLQVLFDSFSLVLDLARTRGLLSRIHQIDQALQAGQAEGFLAADELALLVSLTAGLDFGEALAG